MAEGVERLHWDSAAMLWATLANCHRDKTKQPRAFHPADVHPYRGHDDYDGEDATVKDADYQRERRLSMMPPEIQERVREQWASESKLAKHS